MDTGEGHLDMDTGRGTLGHGHWEGNTRTWTLGEGHQDMDTGRGALGHGHWEGY